MSQSNVPDFLTPIPKTTRSITLPSRGVLYTKGPAAGGKLTLSAMTLVEENLLSTPRTLSGDDGVTAAIKKCIVENIDVNHLLVADKFFIFLMLRAITYGSEYAFNWTCPAVYRSGARRGNVCGASNRTSVNIPDQFQIKQLADEDTEPFMIVLPESGKEIGFRLPRVYDEKASDKFLAEREESENIRSTMTVEAFQLARFILSVDSNSTDGVEAKSLQTWLLSLPAKDIAFYRDRLEYFTPGIDTSVSLKCMSCGTVHKMDLPLTSEFFRPKFTIDSRPMEDEVRPDAPSGDSVQSAPPDPARGTPLVLREIEGARDQRS